MARQVTLLEKIGYDMEQRGWVAWMNDAGIWAMGVEKSGILHTLGMGTSIEIAYKMAVRSSQ